MDNILILILSVIIRESYYLSWCSWSRSLFNPIVPLGDLIIVPLDHPFSKTNAHQHSVLRRFGWFKAPNLGVETTPAAGRRHP